MRLKKLKCTKQLSLIGLSLILTLMLAGCMHTHDWQEADCTKPKTCNVCGKTEGEQSGHNWQEADCTKPKTCSVCGDTEGELLDHDWQEANCERPKICAVCGETEGQALGHKMTEANYQSPSVCTVCQKIDGESLVPCVEQTSPAGTTTQEHTEDSSDSTMATEASIEEAVVGTEAQETESVAELPSYTVADMDRAKYATTAVNIRALPGTDGEKIGSLTYAQEVHVTGEVDNGWFRIAFNDSDAFVSSKYLSDTKPAPQPQPEPKPQLAPQPEPELQPAPQDDVLLDAYGEVVETNSSGRPLRSYVVGGQLPAPRGLKAN